MLWLLAALVALALSSVGAACTLRLGVPGTLLAGYLIAVATVLLSTDALSPVHAVGRTGYLACTAAFSLASLAIWSRRGCPRPPLRIRGNPLRSHPVVTGLGLVVALALAYELFLALSVPPNNWDAMTYHLTRAAAWLEHGGVAWVPAATTRVNVFPVNGEVQILWTLALARSDWGAALPQFLAELVGIVAVFGIARRLGFERSASAFAALILATLAEIALEATSAQNDLDTAAPLAAAAYFVLGRNRKENVLAGLAVGIAIGTKLTAIFALPALGLIALAVLTRKQWPVLVGATAAAVALFAAPGWVANLRHTGSPLGRGPELASFAPNRTAVGTMSTVARIGWRFVDFTGFETTPQAAAALDETGSALFTAFHIPQNPKSSTYGAFTTYPSSVPDEDRAFFGPLGAFLLLPLVAGTLLAGALKRVRREHVAVAAALPLFVLSLALAYRYNTWLGRYLVVPVVLVAPLTAYLYRTTRLLAGLVAVIAAVSLVSTVENDVLKPAAEHPWSLSRTAAETLEQSDLASTIQAIDEHVPRGRIGYAFTADDWTYPLFGRHFQREPVLVDAVRPYASARLQHLKWLVVSRPVRGNATWRVVQRSSWTLLRS